MATLPPSPTNPLPSFHKIGTNIYLYTPGCYSKSEPLVLLFTWMGAATKHIAKYTAAYTSLFPTARILLIRNFLPDFFRRSATYARLLTPALEVVKEHISGSGAGGGVLVHSFSNGGGNQMVEFAKAWKEREGSAFPMRAQVLDSAPGNGNWARSHKAISTSLPSFWLLNLLGKAVIHFMLALLWIRDKLSRREPTMAVMRRQMNDGALFDKWAKRVYLYSVADEMVGHDEVEEHADQAETVGWNVTRVRFEKSPHAGHIREDAERYWSAVRRAWSSEPPSDSGSRIE